MEIGGGLNTPEDRIKPMRNCWVTLSPEYTQSYSTKL